MIETLSLFEPLDDELLTLLRSLPREDWRRATIAGAWTVRDVVAHLLDTPLRRLSFVRDGWPPDVSIRPTGVAAASRRIACTSPAARLWTGVRPACGPGSRASCAGSPVTAGFISRCSRAAATSAA